MSRSRFAAALSLATLACTAMHAQQPDAPPVDSNATPEARALLHEIDSVSGHGTLSGEHNFPNTVSRYSDRILELTGSYPAVFGQDFGFSAGEDKDSTLGRPAMIQEVIRQYHRGAVIALTWHAVRPTEDEPVTFRESVQGHLTDWEWDQLLTPGTDLHTRWEHQVDRIGGYLHELQDAGVPVLFRPYHEINGNWFWWGGRPGPRGSQELYRQLYDRYVHVLGLNNLVWVWNVNAPSGNAGAIDLYFPGPGFADVETMDIYGPFKQAYYDSMVALAGPHKPIALAEVGTMPTLATLAQQPRWAYFMMWSGMAESSNTPQQLQTMFHAPNIIDRGDPRLPAPVASADPTEHPSPVDPEGTRATRDLLTKLAAQRFDAAAAQDTGPTPGLAMLNLDHGNAEELRDALKRMRDAGQVPLLRWQPASPTGGEQRPLDDFEWQQLRQPGTPLHTAWIAQVHALAAQLAAVQGTDAALVLDPLPEADGTGFWWSGRPGPEGSQALLEDLRAALEKAAVHTVLWAWEPALLLPTPQTPPVPLESYFPGPQFLDVLVADSGHVATLHGYGAMLLQQAAGTKPILLISPGHP